MTKNWIAALSALLVAGTCFAGGGTVKDKDAPTTFATEVGCTTPPVVAPPCSTCSHCSTCRNNDHHCLVAVKNWLCFVPLRTCPCECHHCSSCYPALYLYFLRPCVEGAPCYHYDDHCSSCVSKTCATCGTADHRLLRPSCGCNTCSSCGTASTPGTPGTVSPGSTASAGNSGITVSSPK
jgi:hypothetical protein